MADLTQTAANVQAGTGATKRTVTAGATIPAGAAVYFDSADGKYKLHDGGATDESPAGIALTSSSNGQPLVIQTSGQINLGATLEIGEVYVASANAAGAIAPISDVIAQGNYIAILGISLDDSTLQMNLFSVGVPYAEE